MGDGGGGAECRLVPDVTGTAAEDDGEVRGADGGHHHGGGHPQRVQRGSEGGLPRYRSVLSLAGWLVPVGGLPRYRSVLSLAGWLVPVGGLPRYRSVLWLAGWLVSSCRRATSL